MSVDAHLIASMSQEVTGLSAVSDDTDASQLASDMLAHDLTPGRLEEQIATLAASLDPEHQVAVAAKIGLILGERMGIDMVEARLEAEFRSSVGFMGRLQHVIHDDSHGEGAEA